MENTYMEAKHLSSSCKLWIKVSVWVQYFSENTEVEFEAVQLKPGSVLNYYHYYQLSAKDRIIRQWAEGSDLKQLYKWKQ